MNEQLQAELIAGYLFRVTDYLQRAADNLEWDPDNDQQPPTAEEDMQLKNYREAEYIVADLAIPFRQQADPDAVMAIFPCWME